MQITQSVSACRGCSEHYLHFLVQIWVVVSCPFLPWTLRQFWRGHHSADLDSEGSSQGVRQCQISSSAFLETEFLIMEAKLLIMSSSPFLGTSVSLICARGWCLTHQKETVHFPLERNAWMLSQCHLSAARATQLALAILLTFCPPTKESPSCWENLAWNIKLPMDPQHDFVLLGEILAFKFLAPCHLAPYHPEDAELTLMALSALCNCHI